MTKEEKEEIMFSLELRMFLIATKWNPSHIDLDNYSQLAIILKQLEDLWN